MIGRILRKMAGIPVSKNGKKEPDLGLEQAIEAEDRVYAQSEEMESTQEAFDQKCDRLEGRIRATTILGKKVEDKKKEAGS